MTVFVKEIIPIKSGRSEVTFEGETSLVLYKGEIKKYGIEPGVELPLAVYEEIRDKVVLLRAKKRAMHLLEQYDRTEYQIRRKLAEGRYPECVIDEVIAYLYSYHYLDDERYANNYIAFSTSGKSRGQITYELMKRGVDKEIISSGLSEYEGADERENIRRWLSKKKIPHERLDEKAYRRIYGFLARKGFQNGDILSELRAWCGDDFNDDM